MLKQRIITALLLLTGLTSLLIYANRQVFSLVAVGVVLLAAWEWDRMVIGKKLCRFDFLLFSLISVGLMILHIYIDPMHQIEFWPSYMWPVSFSRDLPVLLLLLALPWWVIATISVILFQAKQKVLIKSWVGQIFAGLCILLPLLVSLISLRAIGGSDHIAGSLAILYLIFIVAGADVGAYIAGKTMGKTKLATHISPGKTWEGVIGGLFGAQLIAYFGAIYILEIPIQNYWLFSSLILIISAVSVVGDLFVSLQKRQSGFKDSSQLLPGHGGLLDRLDSLSAALPIGFIGFSLLGFY
jgi:phosphatidate cytidylyltransferase